MDAQIKYYEAKLAFEMDPADLFTTLGEREDIVVIDARKAHGYEAEHIPGAINLPHALMSEENTRSLDRSKLYVCYCDGIGCNASTKGALNMAKLGFQVKELVGGLAWWKRDGYATEGKQSVAGAQEQCAC